MPTSVSIDVLRQHLEDFGWSKYRVVDEPGEREGLIFTGYIGELDHMPHSIIIDPMVEKGVLRIFAPRVATAPLESTPKENLYELFLALAALNYRSVLASFAYDPSDGDVTVAVSMPIEENDLSFEQFKRSLEAIMWAINMFGKGLNDIVQGETTAEAVLKKSGSPEAVLGMLFELLEHLAERVRKERETPEGDEAKKDEE